METVSLPSMRATTALSASGSGDSRVSSTWALVTPEIPCEPRGALQLKGAHHPVRVYAACGGKDE